jgi:ankyrin repeat protein
MQEWNPLHFAAYYGRSNWIEPLIERGFEINVVSKDGYSPLICAISGKSASVLPILLERGADLYLADHLLKTALHHVAWIGFQEGFDFLIPQLLDVDQTDIQGMTPLHWALRGNHFKIAQGLMQKTYSPWAKNDMGQTPYELAMACQHEPIMDQMKARVDYLTLNHCIKTPSSMVNSDQEIRRL